jgi:hypothetical protein
MKRILTIVVFGLAVSLAASFGTAQIEIKAVPTYDPHRDQQWMQQQRDQQREQQQREDWQRAQWQREQDQRRRQHMQFQDYDWWLQHHRHDYDNRR